MTKKTIVGDIEGGKAPAELKPDDSLTIEHLYQTYRWYPGFGDLHDLQVKAIWANGLTDDALEQDRILELKNGHLFAYLCGYVAYICNTNTDPPSVEMWHPEIEGVGFTISEFSAFGYPLQIRIQLRFNETEPPVQYYVANYPVETMPIKTGEDANGEPIMRKLHIRERPEAEGYGFFIVRNSKGLKGVRGLPQFIELVHPVRSQLDILNSYTPYAKKQGMAFPVVFLANNSPANRANVKTQFSSQPQTNRLIMMGGEDDVAWVSPQAAAYDPFPILQWIDMLMARKSQMNKLMLEGDPAGYLSASETAISNWEKEIKEQQTFWRSQFQPIWTVLGCNDDCAFADPSKPAFISLMEGLKALGEALSGKVENEDIVRLMNEYLAKHDKDWELSAISNEEVKEMNRSDQFGNTGQSGNNRSVASQEGE